MQKKVQSVTLGKRADIGQIKIDHILPNRYNNAIGPFVFINHLLPAPYSQTPPVKKGAWSGAQPHRGISTLTYVLCGIAHHRDSKENYSTVGSGGILWTKAGNGIVQDECIESDPAKKEEVTHSLQMWINLPAKNKTESPEFVALSDKDIPRKQLDNESGWIKVLIGSYQTCTSPVPISSHQFIFHLHLEGRKRFQMTTEKQIEYAAFLPSHNMFINEKEYNAGEFVAFENSEKEIEIMNVAITPIDLIILGGEPYTDPIVSVGPFVMNTEHEISIAYNDFYDGKYGEIVYD